MRGKNINADTIMIKIVIISHISLNKLFSIHLVISPSLYLSTNIDNGFVGII